MRRARLSKNANGSFDLAISGVTPAEARGLMTATAGSKMPDSFGELFNQLFDEATGKPITHLRNPVVIGDIE